MSLLVSFLAWAAMAGPASDAADRVVAALRAKDEAAIATLASAEEPDAWFVAAELVRRGEADMALAFSRAKPRFDTERLAEYVSSRVGKPEDLPAWAALERATRAFAEGDMPRMVEEASAVTPADPLTVVGIHLRHALAYAWRDVGRLEESATLFARTAEDCRRMGWHARRSIALDGEAMAAYLAGDHATAAARWQAQLELEEKRGRRPGIAAALVNLGGAHLALGEFAVALGFQQRALAMHTELGDVGEVAKALGNIAWIHELSGRPTEAVAFRRREIALRDEMGDRRGVATALHRVGALLEDLGDHLAAIEHLDRALRIAEDLADRPATAQILATLGRARVGLGDCPGALPVLKRAILLYEEENDTGAVADVLISLAACQFGLGEFAISLACAEEALRVHSASGDRASMAFALNNIGGVHAKLGDYPKALDHLERCLAVREEIGDRAGTATTLHNIGAVYSLLGDHARALELQSRALRIHEETGDRAGLADTLANMGLACEGLGDYARATELVERALRLQEEMGNRTEAGVCCDRLGAIRISLGDYTGALEWKERALRAAEQQPDPLATAGILGDIGIIHARRGEFDKALDLSRRALELATVRGVRQSIFNSRWNVAGVLLLAGRAAEAAAAARTAVEEMSFLVRGLGEEQGAIARASHAGIFDIGLAAAVRTGSLDDIAFFLESQRAGSLLEGLGNRAALQAAPLSPEIRREEAAARAEESVALGRFARAVGLGDRNEIAERRRHLDGARERLESVVARIQRTAKAQASVLYPKADGVEALRGRLRDGEALVLYGLLPERSIALVVTRGAARHVLLPAEATIAAAADLRATVVDPLLLPAEARRVFLAPTGPLCSVPFCRLLPDREIVYLPSGTTYGLLLDEAAPQGEGVLALGDPDYGTPAEGHEARLLRGGERPAPLPASGAEAKAVGTDLLLGSAATEERLLAALASRKRWRAVHLACHGRIDTARPQLSALALAGGDFLTVLDIVRLRIPADLVVLSACETARGKEYRGEGTLGFVGAILFAGAPRVIVSLWRVDDRATRALMTRFYEEWETKPAAAALKAAQSYVASQPGWEDPVYWAAWQLWGLGD